VQQQEGEERPHPLTAQWDATAVLHDLERAENAEFNRDSTFVAPVASPE
jgi:hypothetical protein